MLVVLLLLLLSAAGPPAPAVLAHACCCAPCAHTLPPMLCSLRVWTRRQLMLTLWLHSECVGGTLSSQPAGAALAGCQQALLGRWGLAAGSRFVAVGVTISCGSRSRAHPGLQLALTAPLTRAHPGLTACSVLAHTWLTLKSSPRVVVAAVAAAPGSSSRSGAGRAGQADRDGSFCHWFPRAPSAGSPSQARSLCALLPSGPSCAWLLPPPPPPPALLLSCPLLLFALGPAIAGEGCAWGRWLEAVPARPRCRPPPGPAVPTRHLVSVF